MVFANGSLRSANSAPAHKGAYDLRPANSSPHKGAHDQPTSPAF